MPPRIVVDTNVFIGAILSPAGENREVLRACLLGRVRPLMGAALFHEYDAESRFRALAARGSAKKGLEILDKLDASFAGQ